MLVRNALGIFDHRGNIIGGDGPMRGLANVQRLYVRPIGLCIMPRDVPDGLGLFGRHLFHLVLTRVGIICQMADIGDVDDMGEFIALVAQHTAQSVGENISAHVADMRVVIDRGAAGIHARLALVDRHERFQLTGQAVEEFEVGHGEGDGLAYRSGQEPRRPVLDTGLGCFVAVFDLQKPNPVSSTGCRGDLTYSRISKPFPADRRIQRDPWHVKTIHRRVRVAIANRQPAEKYMVVGYLQRRPHRCRIGRP